MMKLLFSASLLVAFVALPCAKAGSSPSATNSNSATIPDNPVVARGKGFEIRQRAMEQVMANTMVGDPKTQFPPDVEGRILAHLIEIQLVLQKATDAEKAEARQEND